MVKQEYKLIICIDNYTQYLGVKEALWAIGAGYIPPSSAEHQQECRYISIRTDGSVGWSSSGTAYSSSTPHISYNELIGDEHD